MTVKYRLTVLMVLLFLLSAGFLMAQQYNMGSDATQGDYGWFNGSVTTIDLNAGAEAPFDGRMVQWRLNNAFMGGTAIMKVFRDSADCYMLVAEDSRTIAPNSGLNTFTVDIAVREGDLLGIYVSDYDLVMCTTGGSLAMHGGNAGTTPKSEWTTEGFTLAVDALVQSTGVEELEGERSIVQFIGWPNPSGPGFHIAYHLRNCPRASLAIYDITGRLVHQFSIPSSQFLIGSAVWDGKDDSGEMVTDGIYFYRLQAGKEVVTESMIFLK